MAMRLLIRSSWRYHFRHPVQLFFSVLGIALGVAIIVGIDLTTHSARQGFNLSTQSISGQASHRIIDTGKRVPQSVYVQLRNELGLEKISPLIRQTIQYPSDPNAIENDHNENENEVKDVQLIGIDPISETEVRPWQEGMIDSLSGDKLQRLLTRNNTVLVAQQFLQRHQLNIGDSLPLLIKNKLAKVTIIGSFNAPEFYQSQINDWIICDINTAQSLLNLQGYLTQIDLNIKASDKETLKKIENTLSEGLQLVKSNEYSNAVAQLSRTFELNLTALSLLGLLVAMFLIYNTMMFSVVQRRSLLARLRVLGVSRKELFKLILFESLFMAGLATSLGLFLGVFLAQLLLSFVTRTINDLYYVLQVTQLYWHFSVFYKAIFLGFGATLLAAIVPALEAGLTKPVRVLQRSELEKKIKRWSKWLVLPGLLGCILVIVFVRAEIGNVVTGFALVFLLILALICLLPFFAQYLLKILAVIMKFLFSLPGKIAVNNISRSFSRSIVAIAALTVSVSATLGIGLMIDSFRLTVDSWLQGYLKADYFITTMDNSAASLDKPFDKAFVKTLSDLDGIRYVSSDQDVQFFLNGNYHRLTVLDIPSESFSAFQLKEGDPDLAKQSWLHEDAVIISEPYAYRYNLSVGDSVMLPTTYTDKVDYGKQTQGFKVVGVYYHYGSEHGVINMSRKTYNRHWKNQSLSTLGLYLSDEMRENQSKKHQLEQQIQPLLNARALKIIAKEDLHQQSLVIFDRTFRVTNVVKLLVVLVSFVGILSALMAIEIERSREFAILRATGLTGRQLSLLVFLETLSMGIIAAVLAIPMGIALAYLLIEVVNYRSFGWSMQFVLSAQTFVMAVLLALSASILAALYPAWHLRKTRPALALRGE